MGVMRFVVFGAVGFGIGGAIGSPLITFLPGGVALLLWLLVGGAVGGASLGLALKDWRRVVVLALLGAVGFSVGNLAEFVRLSVPIIGTDLGEAGSIAITGTIGGASLGAALGYLEHRKLAGEQEPRVR